MSRILLIEPDHILSNLYSKALSDQGYAVDTVGQAQKAVSLLDNNIYDLILLEIQLADHNGIEFLYELRSYSDWQTIPIIIHTMTPASNFNLSTESLATLGVVSYLYKPATSVSKFLKTVDSVIPVKV